MLTVLIEEITAAYRWARAARAYVAAGRRVAPAPAFCLCPCH